MKYGVKKVTLDKHHVVDPGKDAYYIVDLMTGRLSRSYYLNEDTAWEMARRKNAKITQAA